MEQDLHNRSKQPKTLYKFLEEHLQYEPNVTIEFANDPQMGKPATGKTRPIIARFLRYKDKERIMEQASKLLRGKDFAIFDDIPKELNLGRNS